MTCLYDDARMHAALIIARHEAAYGPIPAADVLRVGIQALCHQFADNALEMAADVVQEAPCTITGACQIRMRKAGHLGRLPDPRQELQTVAGAIDVLAEAPRMIKGKETWREWWWRRGWLMWCFTMLAITAAILALACL